MTRSCEDCGATLPRQTGPGGRRKRCADCAALRRRKPRPALIQAGDDGSIETATRAALAEAGRVDHPLGRTALLLATRLDARADTGAGLAAVTKQLAATLAEAVKGAQARETALDELRSRRNAKLA